MIDRCRHAGAVAARPGALHALRRLTCHRDPPLPVRSDPSVPPLMPGAAPSRRWCSPRCAPSACRRRPLLTPQNANRAKLVSRAPELAPHLFTLLPCMQRRRWRPSLIAPPQTWTPWRPTWTTSCRVRRLLRVPPPLTRPDIDVLAPRLAELEPHMDLLVPHMGTPPSAPPAAYLSP